MKCIGILFFLLTLGSGVSGQDRQWFDSELDTEVRIEALLEAMTLDEKISQMIMNSAAVDRLGVDAYDWWSEALHGVARSGRATVFPQAIGIAATFDPALLQPAGHRLPLYPRHVWCAA